MGKDGVDTAGLGRGVWGAPVVIGQSFVTHCGRLKI